ncbi:MAG: hypothetical protein CVT63_04110 [Candidatus Anoxymicrobium japonicum]|uniref:Beta propeller domain protein n=1 Tax=Candidatus Anoxymicrobium japonicum TaxID=2013648 RepID=A0A2N3G652_9ACTN|nr:MAG: hypothetical protein CVT63_04110 [Candidatus Anoxymicrobium japonicum]
MNKKSIALVLVLILAIAAGIGVITYYYAKDGFVAKSPRRTSLGRFASAADFMRAYKNGQKAYQGGMMFKSAAPVAGISGALEHSSTNVQVEGVDEADIVKNDGRYIYAISGKSVVIVAAHPAEKASVVSRIESDKDIELSELFVLRDRLVVIGASHSSPEPLLEKDVSRPRGNTAFVRVYDISDREKPGLIRNVEYEGAYSTSRMIGSNVHVVLTAYPYVTYDQKNITPSDIIPRYRDVAGGGKDEAFAPIGDYKDIEVVDPESFTSFLSVVSISLENGSARLNKRTIAGHSDNVYASLKNLYVASGGNWLYDGLRYPHAQQDEQTTIYKFKFDGPGTKFLGAGEVPGTILNQFSMDETKGYFRIATTCGRVSREGSSSTNNVYVLGPDMKITGRLEGLARGESIYSVRFMGDRAYLVTFKKVDPLFVLDMTNPNKPTVLGALKIPGYSDYLHPYDETHVIGLGKNTVEASPEEGGNFAWYQGLKLAIFDVTDVANPTEMHKVEIGDRGTDSYALYDHKAFLFDRAKNLLVLPVLLAELTPDKKAAPGRHASDYGDYTFQGAYAYDVSLTSGFELKGRVTHLDNAAELTQNYGYYDSAQSVKRSLWIEKNLYTVSESKIKVNRLDDLTEVATVQI